MKLLRQTSSSSSSSSSSLLVSITALITIIATSTTNVIVFAQQQPQPTLYTKDDLCTTWISQAITSDINNSNGLSYTEFIQFLYSIEEPPSVELYFDAKKQDNVSTPRLSQQDDFIYKIIFNNLACSCSTILGMDDDCCLGDEVEIPISVLIDNNDSDGSGLVVSAEIINEYRNTLCNDISDGFSQTIGLDYELEVDDETTTTLATSSSSNNVLSSSTSSKPPVTVDIGPLTTTEATIPDTNTASSDTTTITTETPMATSEAPDDTTNYNSTIVGTSSTTTTTSEVVPASTTTTNDDNTTLSTNTTTSTTLTTEVPYDDTTTNTTTSSQVPITTTDMPVIDTTTEQPSTTSATITTSSTMQAVTTEEPDETVPQPESTTVATTALATALPAITTIVATDAPPVTTTDAPNITASKTDTPPEDDVANNETSTDDATVDPNDWDDKDNTDEKGLIIDIVGTAWNITSFIDEDESSSIITIPPDFYDANEVVENTNDNNILSNVIFGFASLSAQVLFDLPIMVAEEEERKKKKKKVRDVLPWKRRMLRGELHGGDGIPLLRELQAGQLTPIVVTDIACPDDIAYAPPEGVTCLNFRLNVDTGSKMSNESISSFEDQINSAINAGDLYITILEMFPTTNITGLGTPGSGYDYTTGSISGAAAPSVNKGTEPPPEDTDSGGLSTTAIVFIILGIIIVPMMIVAMFARYRKVQNEERLARLRQYEQKNSPVASVTSREIPQDDSNEPDGSMVGDLATTKKTDDSNDDVVDLDEIKTEIRILVNDTKAPKSADELLAAYAGREKDLLMNLRKMKSKLDTGATLKAEVEQLIKDTGAPKTADEMLTLYKGREDQLIKNLKKMREKQVGIEQAKEEKEVMLAEISSLSAKYNIPQDKRDDMLRKYEGREDELLMFLREMREGDAKKVSAHFASSSASRNIDIVVVDDNTVKSQIDGRV